MWTNGARASLPAVVWSVCTFSKTRSITVASPPLLHRRFIEKSRGQSHQDTADKFKYDLFDDQAEWHRLHGIIGQVHINTGDKRQRDAETDALRKPRHTGFHALLVDPRNTKSIEHVGQQQVGKMRHR